MRIVALVAAYNEADVLGQTLDELHAQGIETYLLDNGSTDETPRIARERIGRGVLAVERFPADPAGSELFPWTEILRRKQSLAAELDADWFLHQDADELRESPWLHRTLRQGIELVDELGFNAIDFEVLNFRPTDDSFVAGADLRATFAGFERAESWDRVQIKAWRRQSAVDLVSTGGHEAVFQGRRVFPLRFLSRHYPIRSRQHGRRKVLEERKPRFLPDERERGWHRQYDRFGEGTSFLWPPEELERFDPERVRIELALRNREWEAAAGTPVARAAELLESLRLRDEMARELDRRNREAERLGVDLDRQNREVERLHVELDRRNREAETLAVDLDRQNREVERRAEETERWLVELDRRNRELEQRAADVARLHVELDGRNREVASQAREVERLNVELDRKNRAVEQQVEEVARLNVELDGRNREVASQAREVERLNVELDRQNRAVERLDADLDRQNRRVELQAREAERLSIELDRRNRDVDRLSVDLDRQNRELDRLRLELETRHGEVAQLAALGEQKDLELARRTLESAIRERELASVGSELGVVRTELERVLGSRTWRWSAPVRRLYWWLTRGR